MNPLQFVMEVSAGNPGAATFASQAINFPLGYEGLEKMFRVGITGAKLYMLWNDVCDRDLGLTVTVMNFAEVKDIVEHINYDGGRGYPFSEEELNALAETKERSVEPIWVREVRKALEGIDRDVMRHVQVGIHHINAQNWEIIIRPDIPNNLFGRF